MKLISRVMVVSCGLVVVALLLAAIVTSPTLALGPLTLTHAGLNDGRPKRNTGNDAENAEHQARNIGVQAQNIVQARNMNTQAENTTFSLKPPTTMLETLRISQKTPITTPKTPITTPKTPITTPKTPITTPKTLITTPKTPMTTPKTPGITRKNTNTHARIAPRNPDDATFDNSTLDPLIGAPSVSHESVPLRLFYEHIPCLKVTSRAPCTFPLLVDHFQRCGYFAETTSWREARRGYPKATMSAQLCQVPSVASGAQSLARFISERNISGIVTVGDSQASRMNKALIEELFRRASFNCTLIKKEPRGKQISLEYYTQGSGFETRATAGRICRTCDSALHVCVAPSGEKVKVEYLSMDMGARKPIHLNGSECVKNPKHPLCQDITQQEYVFRHYLNQNGVYPELVMVFSVFAHTVFTPIREAFDAIQDKVKLIADAVPETSHIIWFGGTPYNVMKETNEPKTPEGIGLPVNKKMQVLNHFLASVLRKHMEENGRPVYPFFDLYNMQAQLKEAWKRDVNHFQPVWYQYVMAYTAAMLNSLPVMPT